jgi:cell fate (sporulation/competence/biofilm development) regulator YlbF (YheA/YmcA/DUF963 family)
VGKENEMTPTIPSIPPTMLEATAALVDNLLQSEPFLRYQEAERKLQANHEATQLLADLSEMQQKVRGQQYSASLLEEDLNRLRELQNAVIDNEVIQEFGVAQQRAVAFLQEVNEEISQLLGIDFASLTRRGGTC